MSSDEEATWQDVDRLVEDLKRDGYEPTHLSTSLSAPAPLKVIQLKVARTDHE